MVQERSSAPSPGGRSRGEASCAWCAQTGDRERAETEERGGKESQTCSQVAVPSLPAPLPAHIARARRPIRPRAWSRLAVGCFRAEVWAPTQLHLPSGSETERFPRPRAPGLGQSSGPLPPGTAGAGSAPSCGVRAGFVQRLPALGPRGFVVVSFQIGSQINAPGGSHLSGNFKCARGGGTKKKKGFPVT